MVSVHCTLLNKTCVVQDCEEGAVKELLLKGENLQRRAPDQDKREQIRLKHNQLNSKYNTVKVNHTSTSILCKTSILENIFLHYNS